MLKIVVFSLLALFGGGLAVKLLFDKRDSLYEITWKEFVIGSTVMVVLVIPVILRIGWIMSVSNLVSYNEYRNGWETAATKQVITCTRDGPCWYEYDCDPYPVVVPYSCNCDKDGCDTCFRTEIHYHSCPYSNRETSYFVNTTTGDFTIAEHRLPENPQAHIWRAGNSIPSWVIDRAGVGDPQFWTAAKKRVDAGSPGPVSVRSSYDNFILASEHTILKQYSSQMEKFESKKLLPKLQAGVYGFYFADKVYFVGYKPRDAEKWQSELRYLNAGLGNELEGDIHLVIVRNGEISTNPDSYAFALQAYWQDQKFFGRDTLSKNGIVVILGTEDGVAVSWSRAFTGMPLGNDTMLVAARNRLKGLRLEPEEVIGSVRRDVVSGKCLHGNGALENILWGIGDSETRFRRVSMSAEDSWDEGTGFLYLRGEINPTSSQKAWITFFVFLACGICWTVFAFIGERDSYRTRNWR